LKANEIYPLYALAVIGQSGYWRPLWIIQEIVLGTRPRVRFGTKEITLKQLDTFLDACNRVVYAVQRRRDHLGNITRPVELRPRTDRSVKLGDQTIAGPEIRSLLSLKEEHNREKPPEFADEMKLNWTRLWVELGQILPTAQCEEPRDRIFGMLGLVDRDVQVEVDYGKSLELIAEQVLKKQLIEYLIVENRFEVQDWRKDEFMKFAGILAEMLRIPGWVEEARKIIHAEGWETWLS